jgi:glycosyltransferase involved in cell wall biosynthesis
MNILMYGWEFPPFHSGGLGVACKGIIEGLLQNGTSVKLVLPRIPSENRHNMPNYCIDLHNFGASSSSVKTTDKKTIYFSPYISEKEYQERLQILKREGKDKSVQFGKNLVEEAYIYGEQAAIVAEKIPHDIIHAHDWMTFPAGMMAKKYSNKPLVIHIHSTEFDRSAGNPNPAVYDIEQKGMQTADSVVAVSEYTKQKIIEHYGISEDKITVIHNAIDQKLTEKYHPSPIKKTDKIVLFLGRITIQKGPDYFISMAEKVLKKVKNVKFLMAGDGDMQNEMIRKAIHLGIEKSILFTGFLRGDDVDKAFQNADLYVMPSVSEPFGLTALEAIRNGAPVLMSNQSGVSEVVLNALKVDFWDVDEMANKVISVLKYPHLSKTLKDTAFQELEKFSWNEVGTKLNNHYQNIAFSYA